MADTGDITHERLSERALAALKTPGQPKLLEAFVALAELYELQSELVTGEHFAAVAQALIATETQSGGPYLTQDFTNDGIVANAAIAYFMELLGAPLPNLTSYLQQVAKQQQSGRLVLAKKTQHYLDRALYVHHSAERRVGAVKPTPQTASVQALTTQQTIHDRIMTQCKERIVAAPSELQASLRTALDGIEAADAQHEIPLLPLFFMESLESSRPSIPLADLELCQTLGVANVFCWIAYTAYDNVLDSEANASRQLPMANLAHRYAYSLYLAASPGDVMTRYITQVFDGMDAANSWELRSCRVDVSNSSFITINQLPRYGDRTILARRAFAHILGPLLVLAHSGHLPGSLQFTHIERGLRHFLIARQLQDDLHDWAQDVRAGQLSFVATDLLRQLRTQPGTYPLDALENRMRNAFWRHGLTRSCDIVIHHTITARATLGQSDIISNADVDMKADAADNFIITLINRLEHAAVQAKQKYRQNQDFINLYNTSFQAKT